MLSVDQTAKIGGIFALLTILHFVADWVFQSHAEAMAKPTNHRVRAKHCFIYAALCLGGILWCTDPEPEALAWMAYLLFFSHFLEDTYLPVFVWARFVRKPPEMDVEAAGPGMRGFVEFASTPLGKILLIAIDQIVHILFLLPVAAMIVLPERARSIGITGAVATALLFIVCWIGKAKK